jgi:hypothetical protein
MPDNNTAAPIKLADDFNPFSDDAQPVQPVKVEEVPTLNEPAPAAAPSAAPVADPVTSFDPNQFIKERFGFESVEQAEQEFARLKEQPKEMQFEFQDDISKTLFDAIKEGKTDDVYSILNEQKKLNQLTTSEINTEIAAEIIKANTANKYKQLSKEDVDLLFYDSYFIPSKPEQGYDESQEDYDAKVKSWQSQVEYVERKMIIDAKVQVTELEKLKSDLKLPDVYGMDKLEAESQEEFEVMQKARSIYEQTLNSEFQSFNGFNVSVKDEEVDIPIAFNVAEEERLAMKESLSDFDSDTYFGNRWFSEDGKPKVQQIMADKYLLENRDKILQKVANEAASQRLLAHLKKTGNITLNQPTPQGTPTPSATAQMDSLAAWAFSS